jgi:hypothetical protein
MPTGRRSDASRPARLSMSQFSRQGFASSAATERRRPVSPDMQCRKHLVASILRSTRFFADFTPNRASNSETRRSQVRYSPRPYLVAGTVPGQSRMQYVECASNSSHSPAVYACVLTRPHVTRPVMELQQCLNGSIKDLRITGRDLPDHACADRRERDHDHCMSRPGRPSAPCIGPGYALRAASAPMLAFTFQTPTRRSGVK